MKKAMDNVVDKEIECSEAEGINIERKDDEECIDSDESQSEDDNENVLGDDETVAESLGHDVAEEEGNTLLEGDNISLLCEDIITKSNEAMGKVANGETLSQLEHFLETEYVFSDELVIGGTSPVGEKNKCDDVVTDVEVELAKKKGRWIAENEIKTY